MQKDLENKLYEDYPSLFINKNRVWCEDGWFDLIHLASGLIVEGRKYIPVGIGDQICFDQIKQKFGGLRLYLNHTTPYINGIVDMSECLSLIICELCGNKGSITNINGRIQTLCLNHYQDLNKVVLIDNQ